MFAGPLKGLNHLFTFSTHLLPHIPSFQRENTRKFGDWDVVPKPLSTRKVSCAAGNGVQPLVPVFQLSFLSGNPESKGRKAPNDPCTGHCKEWWLLKNDVTLCVWLHFSTYPSSVHFTNSGSCYRLALWDGHWGMKCLFLWPLVFSPNSAQLSFPGNKAGLEQGLCLLLLLWVIKHCKKLFSNVESNAEINLLPLCS